MQYFKHMSKMSEDIKIKRLISRHGVEGYGWYCLILERITNDITDASPMPTLEMTCEYLAEFYNGNTAKILSLIEYMYSNELIEFEYLNGEISLSERKNERYSI